MNTLPFRGKREPDDIRVKHGLTDAGWAGMLAQAHSDTLRYDARRGGWRYFDGVRWLLDSAVAVILAISLARRRQRDALDIPDRSEREAVIRACIAREDKRAVWQLGKVQVYDGGADGDADTAGDNTLFMEQGLFVP